MSKLMQRLERLEGGTHRPVEMARAAREFSSLIERQAERFSPENAAVTEADQLERWSPAQRAAWRVRFCSETIEQALAAINFPMPRDGIEVALGKMDALDLEL